MFKKISSLTLSFFLTQILLQPFSSSQSSSLWAVESGSRLKDFRATNQKVALLGVASEFVDSANEERIVDQMRRSINRYSRSYGSSSIAGFNLGANQGKRFFKPVPVDGKIDEAQKKFLQSAGKDNSFEIAILGSIKEEGDEIASELQMYDIRTDTLSPIQTAKLNLKNPTAAIERQAYNLMNCMDREGFVGASPQEFLELPASLKNEAEASSAALSRTMDGQDMAVNPSDLGGGFLAGQISVGGEKTPFWETWWFWSIIGGTLLTAGGLTYYFVVVDQTKTGANVKFNLP